jgi:uncharacterized protein (UPF0264 family)
MKLLVSVASALEVHAAIEGGADLIDAKDPARGALGAVASGVFQQIASAVNGARPVTAALGDASDETEITRAAREYAAAGSAFVKVGFAGISSETDARRLAAAAVRGVAGTTTGVILVAYADASREVVARESIVAIAAREKAAGVLIDTADKRGPGLTDLLSVSTLSRWVRAAHDEGLLAALAGRLTSGDVTALVDTGADIAGVRGAVCDGGRLGRVSTTRVHSLRLRLDATGRSAQASMTAAH